MLNTQEIFRRCFEPIMDELRDQRFDDIFVQLEDICKDFDTMPHVMMDVTPDYVQACFLTLLSQDGVDDVLLTNRIFVEWLRFQAWTLGYGPDPFYAMLLTTMGIAFRSYVENLSDRTAFKNPIVTKPQPGVTITRYRGSASQYVLRVK